MNDFAIETVQSLFENMLDVPQSELETTVMRFREEVKNLGSIIQLCRRWITRTTI